MCIWYAVNVRKEPLKKRSTSVFGLGLGRSIPWISPSPHSPPLPSPPVSPLCSRLVASPSPSPPLSPNPSEQIADGSGLGELVRRRRHLRLLRLARALLLHQPLHRRRRRRGRGQRPPPHARRPLRPAPARRRPRPRRRRRQGGGAGAGASPPARVTRSLLPSIACVRLTPPPVRVLCSRSDDELLLVARGRLINLADFVAGLPCLN
ncbi:hypothetical protein VPH35_107277 [Triticum aestivum]